MNTEHTAEPLHSTQEFVLPLGDRVWVEEIPPDKGVILNVLGTWADSNNSFVRVKVISVGPNAVELKPGMTAMLAKRTLLALVRKRFSQSREGWILHERDVDAILLEDTSSLDDQT